MELHQLHQFGSLLTRTQFKAGGTDFSLLSLFILIIGLLIVLRVAKKAENLSAQYLTKKQIKGVASFGLTKGVKYFFLIFGLLLVMDLCGIPVSSFAAIGAVLMVGISFGTQNITQNLVSGLILLIEKPFKKGDQIQTGNYCGIVSDLSTRFTRIESPEGYSAILPNSVFILQPFVNHSFKSTQARAGFRLSLVYNHEIDTFIKTISDDCFNHESILTTPAPQVLVSEYIDGKILLDINFWIRDLSEQSQTVSQIKMNILKKFKQLADENTFILSDLKILKS